MKRLHELIDQCHLVDKVYAVSNPYTVFNSVAREALQA